MTALALIASVSAAAPIDVKASELVALVWKKGTAQALAHDHVVRATTFTGTLTQPTPDTVSAEVSVDVAGLVVDEDEVRERYRVGPKVSEGDRKAVDEKMKGADQLDGATFGTISFETTSSSLGPEGKGTVSGRLTVRGRTRPVEVRVVVSATPRLEATARLRFKVSDFGITPYSAMLGLIGLRDEVELIVRLVATLGP